MAQDEVKLRQNVDVKIVKKSSSKQKEGGKDAKESSEETDKRVEKKSG
jgi:hypothetical protein